MAHRLQRLLNPQSIAIVGASERVGSLAAITHQQLVDSGCDVFVVADATSSRTIANHGAALERMRADGAQIVTTEMVAFEWLGRAGTPQFKEVSALIK